MRYNPPVIRRPRNLLAASAILLGGTGCGHIIKVDPVCEAAWSARADQVESAAKALDAEATGGEERRAAALASIGESDHRLQGLTVQYKDRESYPERVKAVVAKQKMRLSTMNAVRREPGVPLGAIRYELEIQGDYRSVVKTIAGLYDQPKVFVIDRVEVNITDVLRKWAVVKVQARVFEMPDGPLVVPPPAAPPWDVVAAHAGAPPECGAGATPPAALAARINGARASLAAKADAAADASATLSQEGVAAAHAKLGDDLVRKRDDNKAAYTSRSDELLKKAETAVAGLAELRIKPDGEPDWR
jgi:hypothetical protein